MEGPQPLLLAIAGLVLLVIGDLHAHPLCQGADSIGIAEAFDLHLEIDDTATLVAAEAVIDALIGSNGERCGLLTVEGAKAEHIGAGTLQVHIVTDHVLDRVPGRQFIDECGRKCHSPPPFLFLSPGPASPRG